MKNLYPMIKSVSKKISEALFLKISFLFLFNNLNAQIINTIAGTGTGIGGSDGGLAINAVLTHPTHIAFDKKGDLYFSEYDGARIRKINSSGIISTVAGTGSNGYNGNNNSATLSQLNYPYGIAFDKWNNLYIADMQNNMIRKVDTLGNISTIAGTGTPGYSGDSALAVNANIYFPTSLIIDNAGNIYFSDTWNRRVRKIDTTGIITSIAGGGNGQDGSPALGAFLSAPRGLAIDNTGNIYIADINDNFRIRKVDASGLISSISCPGLFNPTDVCLDVLGNIYASCLGNNIFKITPAGNVSTFAGTGVSGFSGDGGPAINAQFFFPYGIKIDNAGNFYICDRSNRRIRKISTSTGYISGTEQSQLINFYPNPTSDYFTINYLSDYKKAVITIINELGQIIAAKQFTNSENMNFNVTSIAKGIYFVNATIDEKTMSSKLIIE